MGGHTPIGFPYSLQNAGEVVVVYKNVYSMGCLWAYCMKSYVPIMVLIKKRRDPNESRRFRVSKKAQTVKTKCDDLGLSHFKRVYRYSMVRITKNSKCLLRKGFDLLRNSPSTVPPVRRRVRVAEAESIWIPLGFQRPVFPNSSENPWIIHKVLSAWFSLTCKIQGAENCKAPLSKEFLIAFWCRWRRLADARQGR